MVGFHGNTLPCFHVLKFRTDAKMDRNIARNPIFYNILGSVRISLVALLRSTITNGYAPFIADCYKSFEICFTAFTLSIEKENFDL